MHCFPMVSKTIERLSLQFTEKSSVQQQYYLKLLLVHLKLDFLFTNLYANQKYSQIECLYSPKMIVTTADFKCTLRTELSISWPKTV